MQAMIDELAKQAAESLGQVSGKETLASFWQEYLSKNGKIPALITTCTKGYTDKIRIKFTQNIKCYINTA